MHDIKVDVWGDTVKLARESLQKKGFCTSGLGSDNGVIQAYLGVQHKRIPKGMRSVEKAKEFSCPPSVQAGLSQLEKVIRAGNDLNPYQSKKSAERDYHDPLLHGWKVHHLHLGTEKTRKGTRLFTHRTEHLLFCWIDACTVYFIGVYDHNNFDNPKILETLHSNWPGLISDYRMHGVQGDTLSHNEIKVLRKKNANFCLAMPDGTAYGPMGGGMTSSGHNALDVAKRLYLHQQAESFQNNLACGLPKALRQTQTKLPFDIPRSIIVELCAIGCNLFRLKTDEGGVCALILDDSLEGRGSELVFMKGERDNSEWQRVENLLPMVLCGEDMSLLDCNQSRHSLQSTLHAICWYFASGSTWSQIPSPPHPPGNVCERRFQCWAKSGVLQPVLRLIATNTQLGGQ